MDDNVENQEPSITPFVDKKIFGEPITGGSLNTVNNIPETIGGKEFVIKQSVQEHYRVPLTDKVTIPLPLRSLHVLAGKVLNEPGISLTPTQESIIKAYNEEYLLIRKYLGLDREATQTRAQVLKELEDPSSAFHQEMLLILGAELAETAASVLRRHLEDNFMKKEYLVIGHPTSLKPEEASRLLAEKQTLPAASYIIQEKVTGPNVKPLAEVTDQELTEFPDLAERLLTLCLLARKMYHDTGKLIDTRPKTLAGRNFWEWFQKTQNILIADNQPFFIDTRWLWNRDTRFIGKGGINIIDRLGKRSLDRALKKYAMILANTDSLKQAA